MIASGHESVLTEATWRERRAAHEQRVRTWTDPHQLRAARGEKHRGVLSP